MKRINVINNLSIINIEENKSLVSTNDEFKVISCDTNILSEFLSFSNGKTMDEVINYFSDRFNESDVNNFANELAKENIITYQQENENKHYLNKVAVLYKGSLYHELKKELYNSLKIDMELEVGKDNISNIDVDVIIAILDDISYGEILDLNKNLYNNRKPYMFVYYNGEGIVCGPFVVPGKTACFDLLYLMN